MIQININDIANKVRNTVLTGLNVALTGAITATDTVLEAFGKLQNQINGKVSKSGDTMTGDLTMSGAKVNTPEVRATTSAGLVFKSNNGTAIAEAGAGGGGNWTFEDGVKLNGGTANRLLQTDANKNIAYVPAITANRALKSDANGMPTHFDTSTEPSLTELSHVKGVTSAIQTQLNDGKPYLIDFTKTTSTGSAFSTTIVRSYLIPANTFKTGDVVKITCKFSRPASQSSNTLYIIRYSTDNITYLPFAVFSAMSPTHRYQRGYRHLDIVNSVNTTEAISAGAQVLVDDTTVTNAVGVFSINWTQDLYIGIALTQPITTDSSTIESVIIEKVRI